MKHFLLSILLCIGCSQLTCAQDESTNYLLLRNELAINYSFDYSVFKIENFNAEDYISMKVDRTFERFTNMIENTLVHNANIEMKSCKMKLLNEQEAKLELKITHLEADDDGEHTFSFELYHKPSQTHICSFRINTNGGEDEAFLPEFMDRLKRTGKKLGNRIAKIKTKADKMVEKE